MRRRVPGRARASHALRSLSGVWLPCLGGRSFVGDGRTSPSIVIACCAGVLARCAGVSARRASVIGPSTQLALRCTPSQRARAGPRTTDNTGATCDRSPCAAIEPPLRAHTSVVRSFPRVVTLRPHVRTARLHVRTARHYVRTERLHVRTERTHVGTERTHARSEPANVPITHPVFPKRHPVAHSPLSRNHPISKSQASFPPSQAPRISEQGTEHPPQFPAKAKTKARISCVSDGQ